MKKGRNELLPSAGGPSEIVGRDEAAALFSPEDIAKLKMTILTSTDPGVKIEALRKIALGPLPEAEKGALFLRGLADQEVSVRSEAVRCLKHLGLNADVADTIRDLFEGKESLKRRATERLSTLVTEISEAEKSVVLLVLTDNLTDEAIPIAETLAVLEGLAEILSERPDQLVKLTKSLVARMNTNPEEVELHFIGIYKRVGAGQRDAVWHPVRDEFGKSRNGRVRGILLRVLWLLGPPADEKAGLLEDTVSEALRLDESTPQLWDIAGCLVRGGKDAAALLLKSFESADEEKKIVLSILLDRVCVEGDVPRKIKREAATALLRLLKVAGKRLRNRIMECEIVLDRDLTKKTRREFVKEFVKGLEGGRERLHDSIGAGILKLEDVAIKPLVEISRASPKLGERRSALDFLGKVVAITTRRASGQEVAEAVSLCRHLLDGDFPLKGAAAVALGRMCRNELVEKQTIAEVADLFISRLGSTSYPYEILEGLGHICASDRVSLTIAVRVTEVLLRYFDQKLPEIKPSITQDKERDDVYQFGVELSAYTVMVPLIITALEKMCLNPVTTDSLRSQILGSLLTKWEMVSSWKEIWGPGNTTALAGALEMIGCSDMVDTESKLDILESLGTSPSILSVFQAMARICSSVPESEEIDKIAEQILQKLIETYPGFENVKREKMEILLPALGMIASRPRMSPSQDRDGKLRRTVVDVLFEGLKDDIPGVGELLAQISRLPQLPKTLRSEISDRLRSKGVDVDSR